MFLPVDVMQQDLPYNHLHSLLDGSSNSSSDNIVDNKTHQALQLSSVLEAVIFASEKTLSKGSIIKLLHWDNKTFDIAVHMLEQRLQYGALELAHTASGYRIQVRSEHAPLIKKLWPEKQGKLSQAMLETISIIAYKQPVTRGDIEQIRGVSVSSSILRQLFDKGWIVERGHKDIPGKPALLYTTNVFLDAFNVKKLADLPELPHLKTDNS